MVNRSRSPVAYRQFETQAILNDGLLAIERPGGEVEQALAKTLFGAAALFGEKAERTARRKGLEQGAASRVGAQPTVTAEGGDLLTPLPSELEPQPGLSSPAIPDPAAPPPAAPPQPGLSSPAAMAPVETKAKGGGIREIIARAALRHGVPVAALIRTGEIESGLNPKARNPRSSAGGLFGFIDATAAQYGLHDRFDATAAADAAARLMRDDAAYLRRKLGRDPTNGELYLAHQQGAGGAAGLLGNPNASAAVIVGAEAVKLNGGRLDMTAREFARMWTSKFGDQTVGPGLGPVYRAYEPAAIAAALAGHPARTPLVITAGAGAPTLTGRDTIHGRAFDEAAGAAYQRQLEDDMLDVSARIYETYGDDPAELRTAFQDLKRAQLADHVPDAIRLDYEQAFARVERKYLFDAQQKHEKRIDKDAREAWSVRGSSLEESVSRATAGLDPARPESFDVLAGETARLKNHLRDAAAAGWITAEKANDQMAGLDGATAIAFELVQLKGLTPGEIAARREDLRKRYAAGSLKGVNAASWTKLDGALKKAEADAENDNSLAKIEIEGLIKDDIASLARSGEPLQRAGQELDPETVKAALGGKRQAQWLADREEARGLHAATAGFDRLPAEKIEQRLAEIEPKAGTEGFKRQARIHDAAVKVADRLLKVRAADPAGAVDRWPSVEAARAANPDDANARNQAVIKARLEAQAALGIDLPEPLTKAEAQAIARRLQFYEGDAGALDQMLRQTFVAAGDAYGSFADEAMRQVLEQRGIDRATAEMGVALLKTLHIGETPDPRPLRDLDRRRKLEDSQAAVAGEAPAVTPDPGYPARSQVLKQNKNVPNIAHVTMLRAHPELAADFDKKFGAGLAAKYLAAAPQGEERPVQRLLPDGGWELLWPNGYIERFHGDGSSEGVAPKAGKP